MLQYLYSFKRQANKLDITRHMLNITKPFSFRCYEMATLVEYRKQCSGKKDTSASFNSPSPSLDPHSDLDLLKNCLAILKVSYPSLMSAKKLGYDPYSGIPVPKKELAQSLEVKGSSPLEIKRQSLKEIRMSSVQERKDQIRASKSCILGCLPPTQGTKQQSLMKPQWC